MPGQRVVDHAAQPVDVGAEVDLVGIVAAGGYIVGGFNEIGLPEFSLGYLYLPGFAALTIGALAGSPLGIRFSHRVRDRTQAWLFIEPKTGQRTPQGET